MTNNLKIQALKTNSRKVDEDYLKHLLTHSEDTSINLFTPDASIYES